MNFKVRQKQEGSSAGYCLASTIGPITPEPIPGSPRHQGKLAKSARASDIAGLGRQATLPFAAAEIPRHEVMSEKRAPTIRSKTARSEMLESIAAFAIDHVQQFFSGDQAANIFEHEVERFGKILILIVRCDVRHHDHIVAVP